MAWLCRRVGWAVLALWLAACATPSTAPPEAAATAAPPPTVTPTIAPRAGLPRLDPHPCWGPPPAGFTATCGFVVVPLNRQRVPNEGNLARLAVMVLHREGATTPRPPTMLLSGGPGDATIKPGLAMFQTYAQLTAEGPGKAKYEGYLETAAAFSATFEMWLADRDHADLILLDQRGTGFSQPSLDCGGEAPATCYRRLTAQAIDLTAFRTVENAADVNDVRLALGYAQVDLMGGSYGSRLGLTVLRDYPTGVRTAVFDGISPPHVNHHLASARLQEAAFAVLFDHCRADPRCNAAYPNLETRFYALMARLNARPLRLTVGPDNGAHAFDGDDLRQFTWEAMYRQDSIRYLPMLIDELEHDRATLLLGWLALAAEDVKTDDAFSEGLFYTMLCAEEVGMTSDQEVVAAAAGLPPVLQESVLRHMRGTARTCRDWPAPPIELAERRAVTSDVPTLLLSGEFDPATPPVFAEGVLPGLTHGYQAVLPGLGHCEIFKSVCRSRIVADFWADPSHRPDTSCLDDEAPLRFATP